MHLLLFDDKTFFVKYLFSIFDFLFLTYSTLFKASPSLMMSLFGGFYTMVYLASIVTGIFRFFIHAGKYCKFNF